ncbi:MAG: TfoX/Sxy family protein [Rhodanobacter sp.]
MATDRIFVDYVIEQADLGDALACRKMFGEYALYHAGKVVAFACDNSLFIKPSSASQALAPELPQGAPYPGAKDYLVADELLDDTEALRELLLATSAALPLPTAKKRRRSSDR